MCGHNDSVFYKTLYGKYIMLEDGQSRFRDIDNKRLDEILYYLPRAVATYLLDGEIKKVNIVDQGPSSMIIEYKGMAYSPLERENMEEKRNLEGKLTIEGGILHLKIKKSRVKYKKAYNSEEEMNNNRLKRKEIGIYYLEELGKRDRMLSYGILILEERAYLKGIDIRRVDIYYNISTGEYKIRICGKIVNPKSEDDIFKMENCIYLKNEKTKNGIKLYISSHSKDYPIKLRGNEDYLIDERLLSRILKSRYGLSEYKKENK